MVDVVLVDTSTRAMLKRLADRLAVRRGELAGRWVGALQRCQTCSTLQTDEGLLSQSDRIVGFVLDSLQRGEIEALLEEAHRLGASADEMGFTYSDLVYGLHHFEEDLLPFLLSEYVEQTDLQQALVAVDALVHSCIASLAEGHYQQLMAETVQHNRELAALNAISSLAMTHSLAAQDALESVLGQVLEAVHLHDGEIWLLNDEEGRLYPRAFHGVTHEFAYQVESLPLGVGVPGLVAASTRPLIIRDLQQDPRFVRNAHGERRLRSVVGIPLMGDKRVEGVMNLFSEAGEPVEDHDLTFLVAMGRQVGLAIENARLQEELRRRARDLEEAYRRRERFISMVAHDFRGALAVIHGFAQMLAQRGAGPMEVRAGEFILSKTVHLTRLVGDLQDVSRIEAGRFAVRPEDCDIVALARGVVENQQGAADSRTIELEAARERIEGHWDGDRLQQVLNNLVSNAVKYSTGSTVRVRIEDSADEVTVSVIDEGPGLRDDEIKRLFQPYSRLERDQRIKGTGLGLFISKGIVEAHGGTIWVRSAPDKGSTFGFTLPRRRTEVEQRTVGVGRATA